MASNEEEQK